MTDTIDVTSSDATAGGPDVRPPASLEQLAVQLMDRAHLSRVFLWWARAACWPG